VQKTTTQNKHREASAHSPPRSSDCSVVFFSKAPASASANALPHLFADRHKD
jgi:hypothetical protein